MNNYCLQSIKLSPQADADRHIGLILWGPWMPVQHFKTIYMTGAYMHVHGLALLNPLNCLYIIKQKPL